MAIDYDALRTTVNTIFTTDVVPGREVTIIQYDTTPSDPSDPGAGVTDPRASPANSATLQAAFVHPSSELLLGMETVQDDLLRRTREIAIVQPGPTGTYDLGLADEIIDTGGVRRKVTFVSKLQPGAVVLLYFVGVEQ